MSTEILETSPLYQEWVRKATEEGLSKGMAQGMAQGMQEAALSVLRGRFGAVPAALEAAIRAASTETLQPMLEHATDESLEQIAARLDVRFP